MAPEYSSAALDLVKNDPPVVLAKVDATEEAQLAQRFELSGYPTLYFFRKGMKLEYDGGRTKDEIVSWAMKKTGPPTKTMTCPELKKKIEESRLLMTYFGD